MPRFTNILAANTGFFYFSAVVQIPCFIMGMNLYIDKSENNAGVTNQNSIKSLLLLIIVVFLFFSNIKFSNIAMVFVMGAFSVYFIQVLIERNVRSCMFEKMGERSFYMFLTHLFFVRTLPLAYYRLFGNEVSGNIVYIIFLPIMLLGTYWLAGILEKFCKPLSDYLKRNLR